MYPLKNMYKNKGPKNCVWGPKVRGPETRSTQEAFALSCRYPHRSLQRKLSRCAIPYGSKYTNCIRTLGAKLQKHYLLWAIPSLKDSRVAASNFCAQSYLRLTTGWATGGNCSFPGDSKTFSFGPCSGVLVGDFHLPPERELHSSLDGNWSYKSLHLGYTMRVL